MRVSLSFFSDPELSWLYWTPALARDIRDEVVPRMSNALSGTQVLTLQGCRALHTREAAHSTITGVECYVLSHSKSM